MTGGYPQDPCEDRGCTDGRSDPYDRWDRCREEDCVPEATKAVVDKEIPGIGESMRLFMTRTRKRAMLTRGTAGIRGKSLIVNLPGSPKIIKECLEYVLPEIVYATETAAGEHDDVEE